MPDSRKTGVSATWMMSATVSSAEPVLSMPNIGHVVDRQERERRNFGRASLVSFSQINVEPIERKRAAMPIILWLLGVPLSVVVVLWLVHVI